MRVTAACQFETKRGKQTEAAAVSFPLLCLVYFHVMTGKDMQFVTYYLRNVINSPTVCLVAVWHNSNCQGEIVSPDPI